MLLDDDPRQAGKAREIVAGGVLVPATVLLELSWLLESRYRMSRSDVHELLSAFLGSETVSVHDREQVEWALGRYGEGAPLDDMLHLGLSAGADSFITFDAKLAKQAGIRPPVPIVTLQA